MIVLFLAVTGVNFIAFGLAVASVGLIASDIAVASFACTFLQQAVGAV